MNTNKKINKILVSADDFEEIESYSGTTLRHVFFYNELLAYWYMKLGRSKGDIPGLWIYKVYGMIFNAGYLQAMREMRGQSNEK